MTPGVSFECRLSQVVAASGLGCLTFRSLSRADERSGFLLFFSMCFPCFSWFCRRFSIGWPFQKRPLGIVCFSWLLEQIQVLDGAKQELAGRLCCTERLES